MIQLQPVFSQRDQWSALARREGLYYEPLELSMPPMLGDRTRQDACADWYKSQGLVRSLHGAFIDINPASGDAGFRELSRQRCRESCQLARELGAKHVVFHSSCFPFLRGGYLDSWADVCAAFYSELAEEYDLTVFLENSQDLDPTPLEALLRRTESGVCVCLDVGHANYSRTSLEEWFDRLGSSIGYLHLSDNHGFFDDHLPLGEGSVDWGKVHRLWQALDRDTPITLEVGGLSGVEASLVYLDQHGYFGRGN